MKNNFLNKSLLSFSASALLVSGLNAANAIQSASIDLEEYNLTKVVFDSLDATTLTAFTQDINDGNITIENNTTDNNISLSVESSSSTEIYLSVKNADDIKIIRGNTYNGLTLNVVDTVWDDSNVNVDFNLTKTLGTLVVKNDTWNLITIPAGLTTNAKEMIKANKATMIWGWEVNSSSEYNWVDYPNKMEAGRGYWVRTRIANNTAGSLGNVVATDYNTTVLADYNTSYEVNVSNFADVISAIPKKDEWALVGNSGSGTATIVDTSGTENNSTIYFFEDLLNKEENCYFVSIYHWTTTDSNTSGVWINDTEGGHTISGSEIPQNAAVWTKQRLCDQ